MGGGNIGAGLAQSLEHAYGVKLIERNPNRAAQLSELLEHTIVFCGDASDQELLSEENIDQVDVFIAVTNEDEANIMSAMLAKRLGAKKVMVLIQRGAYVDLVQGSGIDVAISPQQATISALQRTFVKLTLSCLVTRRGAAEAIEAIAMARKHLKSCRPRHRRYQTAPGTTIGAIVRKDEVLIAHDKTVIESEDR